MKLYKIFSIILMINSTFGNGDTTNVFTIDLYVYYNTTIISGEDCPTCSCKIITSKDHVKLYVFHCFNKHKSFKLPSNFTKYRILEQVDQLFIRNISIDEISKDLFENYTNLKEVDISNNNISIISNRSFIYLKELNILNISKNKITNLSSDSFSGLKKLSELYLSDNLINVMDDFLFNSTMLLKKLDVSHNRLQSINNNVFRHLIDLEEIVLHHNQITSLNDSLFKRINYLQKLDISDNRISNVDGLFYNLHLLRILNIANNNLQSINSDTFRDLENLEELYMENNQITEIPKHLFKLNLLSLRMINLSNNQLTEMEMWPLYLSNIKYIDLKYNLISNFTNKFKWYLEEEPSLKPLDPSAVIDLQYNKIYSFDDRNVQQYSICSILNFEKFMKSYLHVFRIDNNPIKCNCSFSKRLILDTSFLVRKKVLNRTEQIYKATCSDEVFNGRHVLNFDHCEDLNVDKNYFYAKHCSKFLSLVINKFKIFTFSNTIQEIKLFKN